jgi:hemoglobin
MSIMAVIIRIRNTELRMRMGSFDSPASGREDDRAARRTAFAADIEARTGIDEAMIQLLVQSFYDRVRADVLLGPVFEACITDWTSHLARMCAFWSSVVLMTGRYHGRPMQAHAPLPVDAQHFDRWLALFEVTAEDVCRPAAAALFIEKARMIAQSLELGIATHRGLFLPPGDRLPGTMAINASSSHG